VFTRCSICVSSVSTVCMHTMLLEIPLLRSSLQPLLYSLSTHLLLQTHQVRSQLWRRAETRCLVRDVWIGNATVETCLSLLPAPLYKSRRCRWALHILLDYFLPAYTVLQGLGNLLPFAGRQAAALLAMLRGDVGVRIVLAVLRMYRQVWLYCHRLHILCCCY
jgi:hypothetical protein